MILKRCSLLMCLFAIATPAISQASVIFTNFGPGLSYDTSSGNPVGNAFDGNNYAEGGTFTPGADAVFGSFSMALSCVFGCPSANDFTVALTTDNGNQPGAAIESFNFIGLSLGALGAANPPVTGVSVLHPLLHSGSRYWLTVASSISFSIAWNLNSTGDTAAQAISTDGAASWFSPSGSTPGAFEIDSTAAAATPEPGTVSLLLGGLSLAAVAKRRSLRPGIPGATL